MRERVTESPTSSASGRVDQLSSSRSSAAGIQGASGQEAGTGLTETVMGRPRRRTSSPLCMLNMLRVGSSRRPLKLIAGMVSSPLFCGKMACLTSMTW